MKYLYDNDETSILYSQTRVILKKKTVTLPSHIPDKQADEKGDKLRLED